MRVIYCLILAALLIASNASAKGDLTQMTEAAYKNLSKVSGTLDIYDRKIDAVRNLKFIKHLEGVEETREQYTTKGVYRDIQTGDVLEVNALFEKSESKSEFIKFEIGGILEKLEKKEDKEYTDEEILAFMKNNIETRAKWTGTYDIYDEKRGAMLKLELTEIGPDIRKFGKLSIASMNTKDTVSGANITLDITVEKNNGELSVKSVRIK